jgi:hypothetical protein
VVDACTVMATHLNHLIQTHAAELLGRQEVQQLLDQIGKTAPKLTEDLVPKVLSLSTLHKVLQNLLDEEVPIRDMRTILDVMAEHAPTVKDATELTSLTRLALGRAITQQLFPGDTELQVIGLDGSLDGVLQQALSNNSGIEPGLADNLLQQAQPPSRARSRWALRRCWLCSTHCACCSPASCGAACRNSRCSRMPRSLIPATSRSPPPLEEEFEPRPTCAPPHANSSRRPAAKPCAWCARRSAPKPSC